MLWAAAKSLSQFFAASRVACAAHASTAPYHSYCTFSAYRSNIGKGVGISVASGQMAGTASPVLTFWERNPPFAAQAAAKVAQASIEAKVDLKGTKDTVATLSFASG